MMTTRSVAAALAIASACLLSACGGSATVDSDSGAGQVTSVAPLERGNITSSAAPSTDPAADTGNQNSGQGGAAPVIPPVMDEGAREISEAPQPAGPEGAEREFLDALSEAGINVSDAEDQLIGTGLAACEPEDQVTVNAVAGQLITQSRTELTHEAVVAALNDAARAHLCQ